MERKTMIYCSVAVIVILAIILYWNYYNSSTEEIKTNNYSEINYPALILFHSEHCGHCVNMMGEWKKAKRDISKNTNVFDIEHSNPIAKNFSGIKGFPTIRYYKSPSDFTEYSGNRTSDSFISFVEEQKRSKQVKFEHNEITEDEDMFLDTGVKMRHYKTIGDS